MKTIFTLIFIITISNYINGQIPDHVPTNGLVAYWPFNSNTDDESDNNLNGTIYGSTELTNDRFGQMNSAYDFDYDNALFGQQNDEIYIPYDNILNVNNLTVSVWVYPRQYFWSGNSTHASTIIARWYVAPSEEVWGITFDSSSIRGKIVNPGGGVTNGSTEAVKNTPLTLNQWSHIVMTYDQVNIKLYVNGSLEATASHDDNPNFSTSGISIGERAQYNGYWYHTDGKIDDIGIWNRALTEQEVSELYNTLGVEDNALGDVSVYPNPVKESFRLEVNDTMTLQKMKIHSISGRLVDEIEDLSQPINVSSLKTGVYILRIESTSGKIMNKRIIKR
jgi:hypothetical protein